MFTGFTNETVDFLWGIRFNNERPWFESHREDYLNTLYRPMQALSAEVYERFASAHEDLGLMRRVSRIHRDARRLRGRGPYKDRLWCSMERPSEDWTAAPVFWFELEPEGFSYGMGFYQAPPVTMARFRARLDRDPAPFSRLVRAFARQDTFALEGEDYKRPKGPAPSPLLAPWYNKKSFSLICQGPHRSFLFSHDLADRLTEGYELLLPFYRYLIALEGDPDPRE